MNRQQTHLIEEWIRCSEAPHLIERWTRCLGAPQLDHCDEGIRREFVKTTTTTAGVKQPSESRTFYHYGSGFAFL